MLLLLLFLRMRSSYSFTFTCFKSFLISFFFLNPSAHSCIAFKKNMLLSCIHVFTVGCRFIIVSGWSWSLLQSVHLSWILIHRPVVYVPFSLQHVGSWSLISRSRWKSSWNCISCRPFFVERMGGVLSSFTQKCNTIGESTFFTAIFHAFSIWLSGLRTVSAYYGLLSGWRAHSSVGLHLVVISMFQFIVYTFYVKCQRKWQKFITSCQPTF